VLDGNLNALVAARLAASVTRCASCSWGAIRNWGWVFIGVSRLETSLRIMLLVKKR
jgi:hypothetical protein